ncbi:MAG TPA: acyltransferase [Acidobacteriaceae bacterium]|nr:acyltransferase [Acidobacteriaceae bacterium]
MTAEKSAKHLPELDGIRGLAILGVLCSHGAGLTGLFVGPSKVDFLFQYCMVPLWGGVDLFFALSGFLITGILLRTRSTPNYFRSFYARRVLRIFPIYYLVLTVTVIAGCFVPAIARQLPPTHLWKAAYFLYLQNWPFFWHGHKIMSGYWGVYWSLAVEEQFYFVWPLLVYYLPARTIFRICIIGFICALPLRILLSALFFGGNFGLAQLTSSRVDALFLGSGTALYMYRFGRPVPLRWIQWALYAGAAIMLYIAAFHHQELVGTSTWILTIGITGYALISGALVALSQHHIPAVQRWLTLRPLRVLGKYSYGIYVYHLLLILSVSAVLRHHREFVSLLSFRDKLMILLVEIGIVLLFARLSYDQFESRFLRLKRYFQPRDTPVPIASTGD